MDTTSNIKNRATIFKKNTNSSIKSLESELQYSNQIMMEGDSTNASEIGDVQDRFITFQSAQKIKNKRLEDKNKDLLKRINELEQKINEIQAKLPQDK